MTGLLSSSWFHQVFRLAHGFDNDADVHVNRGDGGTKACMHSFIVASRFVYEKTNIRLVEVCPPAVRTNLGAGDNRSHDHGEPCDEFCADTFRQFAR